MKRGEIWTVAGGPDFTGKPRPAVIVQSDDFDGTESMTVCMFTTTLRNADFLRPTVEPSPENGLAQKSQAMVDKIATVALSKVGSRLGALSAEDMDTIDDCMLIFLGLARRSP